MTPERGQYHGTAKDDSSDCTRADRAPIDGAVVVARVSQPL
jgi:hypothetical protein